MLLKTSMLQHSVTYTERREDNGESENLSEWTRSETRVARRNMESKKRETSSSSRHGREEDNASRGGRATDQALKTTATAGDTSEGMCKVFTVSTLKAPREKERDPHRLSQRLKQIEYGKNTTGYARYRKMVKKSERKLRIRTNRSFHEHVDKEQKPEIKENGGNGDVQQNDHQEREEQEDPVTPDIHQICSKRSFDGQVRKWRRMLHKWDPGTSTGEVVAAGKCNVEMGILSSNKRKREGEVDGMDGDRNQQDLKGVKYGEATDYFAAGNVQDDVAAHQCISVEMEKKRCLQYVDESEEDEEPVPLRPLKKYVDASQKKDRSLIHVDTTKAVSAFTSDNIGAANFELRDDMTDKEHQDIYADWDSDDDFDPNSVGDVETLRKLTQPTTFP